MENKVSQGNAEKESAWGFVYCPCIHESAFCTISLHKSKEGAEKAMEWHREEKRKEWQKIVDWDKKDGGGYAEMCPFGSMEVWRVDEIEILP